MAIGINDKFQFFWPDDWKDECELPTLTLFGPQEQTMNISTYSVKQGPAAAFESSFRSLVQVCIESIRGSEEHPDLQVDRSLSLAKELDQSRFPIYVSKCRSKDDVKILYQAFATGPDAVLLFSFDGSNVDEHRSLFERSARLIVYRDVIREVFIPRNKVEDIVDSLLDSCQ